MCSAQSACAGRFAAVRGSAKSPMSQPVWIRPKNASVKPSTVSTAQWVRSWIGNEAWVRVHVRLPSPRMQVIAGGPSRPFLIRTRRGGGDIWYKMATRPAPQAIPAS